MGEKKSKAAIGLFKAACVSFPNHPVLNPEGDAAKKTLPMDSSESEMDTENEGDKEEGMTTFFVAPP